MKLHTAEIKALENRIEELGGYCSGTIHLQRKREALLKEDSEAVESLVPRAIEYIEKKFFNGYAKLTYKRSGTTVLIVNTKSDRYALYIGSAFYMYFADIPSVARFLLVAEDMILETSVEE